MILVDANIFMYAAGNDHPHKLPSLAALARIARNEIEAATDAEVLQEILHRYRALERWAEGRQVYDLARTIVPTVLPLTGEILDRARQILDSNVTLSARDALHASIVLAHRCEAILSFDQDFDRVEGLKRVEPAQLA